MPVSDPGGRPVLAIVIDDMGLNRPLTRQVAALPGPLTLAYLTYAGDLRSQTRQARAAGHELIVHVSMEPQNPDLDPGPHVLAVDMSPAELRRRLDIVLSRFDGFVGINNHMGSRFTAHAPGMEVVMETLASRGLLFLDSRTAPDSVATAAAALAGVPHAVRDVFLDNERSEAAVRSRLDELLATARRHGAAVGIGHPHRTTVAALRTWLPTLDPSGVALVPLSAIVRRNQGLPVAGPVPSGRAG